MIFYTSIASGISAQTHAEQWAAIGDDHLIKWQKLQGNPVLTEALHGEKKIYDWRDPFIFHDRKNTFMVTGGNLDQAKGGHAVVNIYEAENAALTLPLLLERDIHTAMVVCAPVHLIRARWIFRRIYGAQGVTVRFRPARIVPTAISTPSLAVLRRARAVCSIMVRIFMRPIRCRFPTAGALFGVG